MHRHLQTLQVRFKVVVALIHDVLLKCISRIKDTEAKGMEEAVGGELWRDDEERRGIQMRGEPLVLKER